DGVCDRGVLVVAVAAESWLCVGPGWDELVAALATPVGGLEEERCDCWMPLVFERGRRNADPRVVGQQRDDRVDIVGHPGLGNTSHELAFAVRVRQRGSLSPLRAL